ncbi:MAG TPA: FxLYD domain-containing protein [Terriglobia bacterium]|nr:FxLYD domain-containing protein [Terriglobia bacterium]
MGERRSAIIIAASIVIVVGLVLLWAFIPSAQDRIAAAPLTEVTDISSIQDNVQLSHLSIATSENFVGHKIRLIEGMIKNVSNKPIRMAEVKMVFTDYDGKPVQEYSQKVLDTNQKPLAPGDQFRFEVHIENLPRTWNYRVPVTEVTKIGY